MTAAARLVLPLLGGGSALRSHRPADRAQTLNRRVTAVMAAPDAHTSTSRARTVPLG